ncbi:Ribosome small subunit biogenesis RbfA-release protein RsgA [uncultured Gammaproteobacteria bacterium]|uniref:ribosome small subunit-dependent GTPase A n=1 Tax=Bathymodiolus heckerae thiotrophic gill symbiont TaxID=1052212 RepID=UPI0010B06151|nr:ribosome small subunit-dependent GTPase A [Bathymodiolus heckerae thiotrophic gill symbiont]CAC9586634.1 Ribosome small subunit biogenesis RbfA-release protein RsgA [uncultured Gammaproteobacteria bacterium]CAC9589784.1 Ribosome small subunit biogenesis RbfA-release protein RsgA [uncultured Gammaproteobacteria bacterium]SHN92123.1 Ribosome small subunit-stimulated GTPase EngC [Bathymodiolus heckerae thiotrophic gill symbiont]
MPLNRRQKWRIEKIQAERIARANRVADDNDVEIDANDAQTGKVITRYGQHLLVENESGDLFQCTGRRNIEISVAGDQVIFQTTEENKGVVTALLERTNSLARSQKLIAANIDELWLVVAIEPHYQFELIDRYLVVAENAGLPINIVVNKIELSNNFEQVIHDFSMYKSAGYSVSYLSVKEQTNVAEFKAQLNHKTHIFLGQSGVGKSSLINELIPDLNLRVNELSTKSKLGKHTTTNTTLYHIPSGGDLIDSPGIREFQLDDLTDKEILSGFREFKPFIGECKFRNCAHIKEPKCAIKTAVENGDIHPMRYTSYLQLIDA